MKESQFFFKQTISSRVKAGIVSEYFPQYCKIIVKRHLPKQIRYIDLFAGPGIYGDGNYSTPILVGQHCHRNDLLRNRVQMIFNDNVYRSELEENFKKIFPDGTFPFAPRFGQSTIGEDPKITEFLVKGTHKGRHNEAPALLFIDPFGYKGIETKVLAEFLRNWGNEIFLFVNTKRLHPALENEKFESIVKDIFPLSFTQIKNDRRYKLSVLERLSLIINSIAGEYEKLLESKIYYTAFKFQEEDSDGTSHYILHLTKSGRGFDLIKTIYNDFANVGTVFDGHNTYTFDSKKLDGAGIEMFDMHSVNIDMLKDDLLRIYSGREISALDLFEEHQVGSLYSRSHYTQALRRLATEGKVISQYSDEKKHVVPVLLIKECSLKFV
ncbi:MAG: three-Cys-motif partner protein TcmP [Chitinophagaceae bacterium]|nr:MAG: three-Cys-motif partner protein TcmP [Chitinophagaceae bacterium]